MDSTHRSGAIEFIIEVGIAEETHEAPGGEQAQDDTFDQAACSGNRGK